MTITNSKKNAPKAAAEHRQRKVVKTEGAFALTVKDEKKQTAEWVALKA